MSLMRKVMSRRFATSPAPAKKAAPLPDFKASPVHPGKVSMHDPPPSPPPRVSQAERRARLSEGQLRRNAPVEPVKTVAPVTTVTPDEPELPVEEPIRGEPLPPPPPIAAPLSRAVELAAAASADKQAQAAALEAQRAELEAKARWKSPCKAFDAGTGLQCGLLQGHTVAHRHARGEFVRVASGPVRREVDGAAWASTR